MAKVKDHLKSAEESWTNWDAKKLVGIGDVAFLYLYQYGYFGGKMRLEIKKQ